MRTEKERPRTQPASGVVLSVDDRPGSADAHHGGGQFFPGLAAADAVGRQPYSALEAFQGVFGIGAENTVQRAGGISQCVLFLSITTTKNHQKIGGPWMVPR